MREDRGAARSSGAVGDGAGRVACPWARLGRRGRPDTPFLHKTCGDSFALRICELGVEHEHLADVLRVIVIRRPGPTAK